MNKKLIVFFQETTCLKKEWANVITLSEYKPMVTHCIALYVKSNCLDNRKLNTVTYFDNFRVGHILDNIKKFVVNKNTTTNSYRIKSKDSIMCG